MKKAFDILKDSLVLAAKAADAVLEDLIEIPEQATEIIVMLASALKIETIHNSENYV